MALIPTQETLTVGGRTLTDISNLKVLYARTSGSTNKHSTPREAFASSGYTPSGVNRFKIVAMKVWSDTFQSQINLGYSDNDTGQVSNSTSYTNPVFISSASYPTFINHGNTQGIPNEYSFGDGAIVPNGKYLALENITAADNEWQIFGYEVT